MSGLAGKVAIVTGGSRGIGAAIARKLGADGANVVVNYSRNEDAARHVVAQVERAGSRTIAAQADMSDPTQIEALFARTMEAFGRVDILVNNAALSGGRPLETTDALFYDEMFAVNVRGPLLAMRFAAQYIGPEGGRIVNISSGITRSPTAQWAVYAASKSALETMTACLAVELGPRHITVNAVAPGITQTDMLREVMPADVQQRLIADTPLGRLGQTDDIADVVAFLCGHEARWITGQTLIANGGLR
jgi:3-oxoacyl-[acyl-carrier protein] reductase